MLGSLDIGSLFGIRVRLHWTFVVLIVVLLLTSFPFSSPELDATTRALLNLAALALLFGIVLLHELGHGIVARRFGLTVLDVTLWPLGGMTRMSRIPESPRVEGWIAFAGPAVNLALALVAVPFLADGAIPGALRGEFVQGSRLEITAALFAAANVSLALFNLLPAFPLDGGRITRALFALRCDWPTATGRTARVGRWVALFLIAYGVYTLAATDSGSWMLPLFGVFLWASGWREVWQVRMRHAGEEFARAMGVDFGPRAASTEAEVVDAVPQSDASPGEIDEDDPTGARRPISKPILEGARGERLTDEQIAALERFRGRIGRAPLSE